jgi:hypothetical protein
MIKQGLGQAHPNKKLSQRGKNFQELKISCPSGTVLALTPLGKGVFMDIEVKRMSPTAIEMLDQLSAVCKRFRVDYYAASQNQRDLLDSIALHEYQLKKAHEQGLKRSEVPPFLGLKRSDRSNDMPA